VRNARTACKNYACLVSGKIYPGRLYNLTNHAERRKTRPYHKDQLTLQILSYEFLGPIRLSEWGPPMEQVVYILLTHSKGTFHVIYVGESEKSQDVDFFKSHEKSKCWADAAGYEANLYLSIYPMWKSTQDERKRLANKIINKYRPSCNEGNV